MPLPHPTHPNDSDGTLTAVAAGLGGAAALIGAGHLIAWLSGAMTWRGMHAGTMKANTSLCFVMAGTALVLVLRPDTPLRRRAGELLAGLVVLIAGATLWEHLLDVDLGIDQLVAREAVGAIGVLYPNRMGPPASLGLTLFGAALLLLYLGRPKAVAAAQSLGMAICLLASLGLLGHLYHVPGLHTRPHSTTVSLPTAATLLLLGLGLLLARPRQGLMTIFTSDSPGGVAIRRLLVPGLLLPILAGWLLLEGELHDVYDIGFGTSVLVLSWMLIFTVLAYQAGKRAEAQQTVLEVRRAGDALRESEEKFRAVFQQAAVGMGRVGFGDARWIDVNDAFCRMLGYSREEMRATPWPEMTHPEDLELDLVPFRRMAAGELESYSVEKRFVHKKGHPVWARLTLSLVRDSHGASDYEIAIIEDITDRKKAEEALRRAKDELELRVRERTRELEDAYRRLESETEGRLAAVEDLKEKEQLLVQQSRMAAMGEMLGNIAHQWRQPLNILALQLQQMEYMYDMGKMNDELMREEVAKAMQLIRHMSQTIDDFKDFLKSEKQKRPFSVNGAVTATISLLEGALRSGGVEVTVHQRDEVTVDGHRNEFSHVIMNLINNARDAFRERGTPSPAIAIEIFMEDGRPVVTVADNAGGIPDAVIGSVFLPYFTTKEPDRGTGIGLFMSKSIIEKSMGGRLTVRNKGGGAEFRIEL